MTLSYWLDCFTPRELDTLAGVSHISQGKGLGELLIPGCPGYPGSPGRIGGEGLIAVRMNRQTGKWGAYALPERQGGWPAAPPGPLFWNSQSWCVGRSCASATTGHLGAPHTSRTHISLGLTTSVALFPGRSASSWGQLWLPWVRMATSQSRVSGLRAFAGFRPSVQRQPFGRLLWISRTLEGATWQAGRMDGALPRRELSGVHTGPPPSPRGFMGAPEGPPNRRGPIPLPSDSEPACGPAGFRVTGSDPVPLSLFPCPWPFPSARHGVLTRRLPPPAPRPHTDQHWMCRISGTCVRTAVLLQNDCFPSARRSRPSPGVAPGVTSWELHAPTQVHAWECTRLHAPMSRQPLLCHTRGCEGIC